MSQIQKIDSPLARKDFLSQVEPRWCLGCGCYGVFKSLTGVFPAMGIPKEKFAVLSGIGCSSRLPYYLSTYGFHTIHGRAPTVAMGLKLARPELSVWVMTGDGDALSIGGNHFLHLMRRNPDIKMILFNNQIYGLTKGQTSPTTSYGTKTKSTPYGSIDNPAKPLSLALAAGATFAARVTDSDGELLTEVLTAAAGHKGIAFIEVVLNCVIFNDGSAAYMTDKTVREDNTVKLRAGEPLVFGAKRNKGIRLGANLKPEVIQFEEGAPPADLLVHDPLREDSSLAFMLSQMDYPEVPVALGLFRKVDAPVYEEKAPVATDIDFDSALRGSDSWVEGA